MSKVRYQPGDAIALKPRTLGSIDPQGKGQIVSVLPETQLSVRYRVRLHNENFDRSISQDDIDHAASAATVVETTRDVSRGPGSSWVDLKSIKTRK